MSVRERTESTASKLTASERKLAAAILSDYPHAGLETIQDLAGRAEVSAPSISRFVAKIGLDGYQDFQRRLIAELKKGIARRSMCTGRAARSVAATSAISSPGRRRRWRCPTRRSPRTSSSASAS